MGKEAAILNLTFEKLSGGLVKLVADGRKVSQQTPLVLRKESAAEEIAFKTAVTAELVAGAGDEAKTYSCKLEELVLDTNAEKQWKQIGSDPAGLRLQVRFLRRTHGPKTGFAVADIRATLPDSPKAVGIGET